MSNESMLAAKLIQDAINDDPRMMDDQVALADIINRCCPTTAEADAQREPGTVALFMLV